ncbi:membrane protein insertase YidC [uncultured Jatrophihabitans sp.]|uniref:membrane protein insertase YidC n=1 Tax=uncultured Jatrophihabitans sp. TaxID=1610747 RepID=UPI0035CB2C8A
MLNFLYVAVSWVLLRWHDLFTLLGFSDSSGFGWALSIVFLVITARVLLFRLFIKQVHYTRNMQKMQPKIQKLKEKHKNDRAALNREMMALQQEEGFNPISGCLPMLLQIPVFIGLYHVLRHLSNSNALCQSASKVGAHLSSKASDLLSSYTFSQSETCHASTARIFDSPLAASFHDSSSIITGLGGDPSSTRIVLVVLLIISAAATFATQLMVRASATTTPEGTAATIQKFMLYVIPIGVLASGLLFNFPLGVLLYWFTNNLWTLGQQGYIIRFHPPTDEPAKPVGELGKTLAPRPGQKPARVKPVGEGGTIATSAAKGKPSLEKPADTKSGDAKSADAHSGDASLSDGAGGAGARTVPRPGQRPNRPGGKRPPAKRPTQAKKRR